MVMYGLGRWKLDMNRELGEKLKWFRGFVLWGLW